MKNLLIILALTNSYHGISQSIFDDFNDFLANNVAFGLIDYGNLKQNPDQLKELQEKIKVHNLKDSSQQYKTAFYINAYNILVIKRIADNYPVSSPMDIEGFFKTTKHIVAGERLTLDQIEFDKLIGPTKDPRIHFALGCGARSCPFLYDNAFRPKDLEQLLEIRAKEIIERSNYVFVDDKNKSITLNKIFDWYREQFISASGSLIKYINQYKSKKIPESYKVKFHEYDWTLNDI